MHEGKSPSQNNFRAVIPTRDRNVKSSVSPASISLHLCFPNTPIDQSHEDTRTNHTGSRVKRGIHAMSHRPLIFPRFRLAEIVETYRFPIVPVHQQLENFPRNPSDKSHVPYASPIHPPPSSFLSSISVLSLSSSFYLLFHRFLPTVCHRSGREGKEREGEEGDTQGETFETVLTDCLTHRRIKDGLPGCLPPRATFLWNLHLFSPTDRCEPWNLARGRMEPRSTWRAKTKATPSWRETIKLAKP